MILLSGAGPGTYGPFFIDGGNLQFGCDGSTSSAGTAVTGTMSDEFGTKLQTLVIANGGVGPIGGVAPLKTTPSGEWTFVVSAIASGINLTVRRISG